MDVFISHAHENRRLAEAWQRLLRSTSNGLIDPWYSSDPRADGGTGPGNWRQKVREHLESATVILILITPGSNQLAVARLGGGFASGRAKTVIPITYFVQPRCIHSVFHAEQHYNGEDEGKVLELCARLISQHNNRPVPADTMLAWRAYAHALPGDSADRTGGVALEAIVRRPFSSEGPGRSSSRKNRPGQRTTNRQAPTTPGSAS